MILHLNSNNDCENSVRVMLTNFFYNNLTYLYKVIINVFMLKVIMTAINIISPQATLILQEAHSSNKYHHLQIVVLRKLSIQHNYTQNNDDQYRIISNGKNALLSVVN